MNITMNGYEYKCQNTWTTEIKYKTVETKIKLLQQRKRARNITIIHTWNELSCMVIFAHLTWCRSNLLETRSTKIKNLQQKQIHTKMKRFTERWPDEKWRGESARERLEKVEETIPECIRVHARTCMPCWPYKPYKFFFFFFEQVYLFLCYHYYYFNL